MKILALTIIILGLSVSQGYSQQKDNKSSGYGHVDFASSGARSAQADFLEGMALLHDFEYPAAAEAFRRAEAIDPSFAMAYWGEAMTFNHPIWMQQDLTAARAALAKLAPTPLERLAKVKTAREKVYFNAVEILYGDGSKFERDFRYEDVMAIVHKGYPDDVDGTAFYGLAILGTSHAGRDIPTYMRAASVLEEAWVTHQEHPGLVHYLIHSYDDPTHAPLGLRSARIYARIAPDAGHAQHMTSHIFLALGMWNETVDANIAAMAAVDRMRAAQKKNPVRCGHYPSWLEYAYLQLGKMDDAKNALVQCRATIESEAAIDHPGMSMDPDNSLTASYANMRLRYLLDTGDWKGDVMDWKLPKSTGPGTRLDFAFASVISEIEQRQRPQAVQALKELDDVAQEVIDLETKNAGPDPSYRVRPDIFRLEAKSMLAIFDGDFAVAERLLRDAVALEEKLPIAFGPPTIEKPTRELLGEFLLRRGRKSEAHEEFKKAIAGTPGRRLALQGLGVSSSGTNP